MRAFAFLALFALTSCAQMQKEQDFKNDLNLACKSMASEQKRSSEWLSLCLNGNKSIFEEGYRENLSTLPKNRLCDLIGNHYGTASANLAMEYDKSRKLNCNKYISDFVASTVGRVPLPQLCVTWVNRNEHPALLSQFDKEVQRRKVDCQAVVSDIRTQATADRIAEAAESANAIARHTAIQNNINSNRPKTCYGGYGSVTCY